MKSNIKILIGIIVGIIVSSSCIVVAKTIFSSEEVSYSNSTSGGSASNVKGALDELYARAGYQKEEYTEEILNGADPVLSVGMIPIYLDGDGNAYYANTHTAWYSYEAKKWANAVILVDDAYDKYHTGDKILEEDIESYFVWIPRYAYKIWNLGKYDEAIDASILNDSDYDHSISKVSNNARIIDVIFGSPEQLESGTKAKRGEDIQTLTWNSNNGTFSEPSGIAVDNYLIHPGFILGNEELNGIWVGKFETGYNQTGNGTNSINTSSWVTEKSEIDELNSDKIIIKPSVYSWRGNSISNIFKSSLNYKEDLSSHMMRNTEWGAVTYLSHSQYGKGAQLNVNNNEAYLTGFSAAPDSDIKTFHGTTGIDYSVTQPWNSATGYLASTTGNITGVYDMSGGAHEYVAATIQNTVTSGFDETEIVNYAKQGYIDLYKESSNEHSYSNRILGDATGEIGPFYAYFDAEGQGVKKEHSSWYSDYARFIYETKPWFFRGGAYYHGILAGQFDFDEFTGAGHVELGFRVVLVG